ncbi:hypothetical protein Ddye_007113 [Dipteronia dyeriana]|uniref:Uncharacterized protein n=1 Tax=Dipteronia dyeriana TaxID=168575 RepID=A0AAE0CR63_9ROSI|nr:hypothetical protein Ddye_007113 [Dipteronia dyeriana]
MSLVHNELVQMTGYGGYTECRNGSYQFIRQKSAYDSTSHGRVCAIGGREDTRFRRSRWHD